MYFLCALFLSAVMTVRFVMNLDRLYRVKPKYYELCPVRLCCNACEIVALGYLFKCWGG